METGRLCRWQWGKAETWSWCKRRKRSVDGALLQHILFHHFWTPGGKITWILILCSQLIVALSLLNKAEGGALQKYQSFSLIQMCLEPSTGLSKYITLILLKTLYVVLHSPCPRSVMYPLQVQLAASRKGAQRAKRWNSTRLKLSVSPILARRRWEFNVQLLLSRHQSYWEVEGGFNKRQDAHVDGTVLCITASLRDRSSPQQWTKNSPTRVSYLEAVEWKLSAQHSGIICIIWTWLRNYAIVLLFFRCLWVV